MNVEEYLADTGMNLHQLSQRAEVSYEILRKHVKDGGPIGLKVASKLHAFDSRLTVAAVLGLPEAKGAA